MIRLRLLAIPVSLVAFGCAHYVAEPLDPAKRAGELEHRRLGARRWTLSSLIEYAVSHHPDVAVARAQYETARAAVRSAGERPNPTVALSPQIVTPYTDW